MEILGLFDGEIIRGILQWGGGFCLILIGALIGAFGQMGGVWAKIPWLGRFFEGKK